MELKEALEILRQRGRHSKLEMKIYNIIIAALEQQKGVAPAPNQLKVEICSNKIAVYPLNWISFSCNFPIKYITYSFNNEIITALQNHENK